MSRITQWLVMVLWLCFGCMAAAQQAAFSGLARVDPDNTRISEGARDGVRIELALSQGVPYRLFTLDAPYRLILDFQEVDWTGLDAAELAQPDAVTIVRFGGFRPGWSRMVIVLENPIGVQSAEMTIDDVTAAAKLTVSLNPIDQEDFAARAGAPSDPRWDLPEAVTVPPVAKDDPDRPLRVVLDPGHGGIDPGAERGVLNEKTLMLTFARELQDILLRSDGYEVILTRDGDYFVSLEQRIALAHQADADVFLSLHADSLSEGLAHGATVYVLSEEASDVASAKLAERHERSDLLSGVDLSAADDEVTSILLSLARMETQPRTDALAKAILDGMAQTGGPMNRRPLRSASFSVLKAADIPSILIEIGFLSSPRDLKNLQDALWRQGMAEGIRNGLNAWRVDDAALRPLVRN